MAAWRYKISPLVLKNISLVCCAHWWNIFLHLKINFVSLRDHVMSSVSFLQSYYMLWAEF